MWAEFISTVLCISDKDEFPVTFLMCASVFLTIPNILTISPSGIMVD